MAWASPKTWSVGEVVTAAMLNTEVRDNLNYLKGNAGTVTMGADIAPTGVAALRNDGNYQFTCERTTSVARKFGFAVSGSDGSFGLDDVTAAARRMTIDVNGNVGFGGVTSPTGRLQVAGASGSLVYLAGVVNGTLNTLAVAGTVATFMGCYIIDYNAGTATVVHTFVDLKTSSSVVYTNTDSITVAVTAGGAITFQRTAGSNNHNVLAFALYF